MVDMTNCPNCGAVITGPQCEYCGTRFRPSMIFPETSEKSVELMADNQCIVNIMTPNEIRRFAGLSPIEDRLSEIDLIKARTITFIER